jgi:hypothetical protein
VKRNNADGSVGFPHVRVGHRQAPNNVERQTKKPASCWFFCICGFYS